MYMYCICASTMYMYTVYMYNIFPGIYFATYFVHETLKTKNQQAIEHDDYNTCNYFPNAIKLNSTHVRNNQSPHSYPI